MGQAGQEASATTEQGGGSWATYISTVNLADSPLDSSRSPSWAECNLGILGKRCCKKGQGSGPGKSQRDRNCSMRDLSGSVRRTDLN